jgi:FkbM family methyltransferase
MISVKEPIKNVARRVLSENSYGQLTTLYSKVRREFDEPRSPQQLLRDLKDARIDRLIAKRGKNNKDFFFIQVGSCDGESGDPIYQFVTKFAWRGILVEPISHLFEKLLVTYEKQNGLFFENIAISSETGLKKMYRVTCTTTAGYVPWHERCSSFYKEHLLKQIDVMRQHFPGTEIVEEDVLCRPFEYLIDKYNVGKIDLLHIDAEGYDYEIIKMVPFRRIRPNMIFYESAHLRPEDKVSCENMLVANGYKLIKGKDTFAYLP